MPEMSFTRPLEPLCLAGFARRRGLAGLGVMAAVWLAGAGCTSVYERAEQAVPPDPGNRLTLRVEEARRAEGLCTQSCARLHDDLARHAPADTVSADLDRLELAGFDLQRRTTAAREAAASSNATPETSHELDHLEARSKAVLDYVRLARKAEPAAQFARLEALLQAVH